MIIPQEKLEVEMEYHYDIDHLFDKDRPEWAKQYLLGFIQLLYCLLLFATLAVVMCYYDWMKQTQLYQYLCKGLT